MGFKNCFEVIDSYADVTFLTRLVWMCPELFKTLSLYINKIWNFRKTHVVTCFEPSSSTSLQIVFKIYLKIEGKVFLTHGKGWQFIGAMPCRRWLKVLKLFLKSCVLNWDYVPPLNLQCKMRLRILGLY